MSYFCYKCSWIEACLSKGSHYLPMCTILVNRLEDQACPVSMWLGKLTLLDRTPLGCAIKPQHKYCLPEAGPHSVVGSTADLEVASLNPSSAT